MKVRGFSGGDVTTGRTVTLPSPLQGRGETGARQICCAFNTESTNSKTTVLLARVSNGHNDEQNS